MVQLADSGQVPGARQTYPTSPSIAPSSITPQPMTQPSQLTAADTMTHHHHNPSRRIIPVGDKLATSSNGSANKGDGSPNGCTINNNNVGHVYKSGKREDPLRKGTGSHREERKGETRGDRPPPADDPYHRRGPLPPSSRDRRSYYRSPRNAQDQHQYPRDGRGHRDVRDDRREPKRSPRDGRDHRWDRHEDRRRQPKGIERENDRYREGHGKRDQVSSRDQGETDGDERRSARLEGENDKEDREGDGAWSGSKEGYRSRNEGGERRSDVKEGGGGRRREELQERDRSRMNDESSKYDNEGQRTVDESERDRDLEHERDRYLGRDRNQEPLRREPVGEETGYDSDHSRVSRTTALSSSRSLRRTRAESVTSQASVFSRASTRPPPIPGRTPRGGYDDAYGSREMYDQYQYYYQYYRDHPYYLEYYRQWMKQCGQAYPQEPFYDRTSIHSGRSSVNDELKKSISSPRAAFDPYGYSYGHTSHPPHNSSPFLQDFHGGRSSIGAYEPSSIYPESSFSQLRSYASGELSGVPSVTDDIPSEAPQRMTPIQFGRPHINARFTPGGQLLMVLPKDPRDGEKAVVQLRDVQKMLCLNPSLLKSVQQMRNYPGPLTLADTHKEVVVKYCEQQVIEATNDPTLQERESVVLMWEYLALLVKQNGKLYGTDIAGLLLKGREVVTRSGSCIPQASSEETSEASAPDSSPQDEGIDLNMHANPPVPPKDESLTLKKFTEYLCLGRKREAVDYAMREGLWGHALALSYKMDTTTHTRVLAAFSNSIPRTDVLLTLFQQLSGKRPEITKTYTPSQWGDWRQHLAMMVSNPTGNLQRDRASILALGETLASRRQLHAAHFCYLVAEAEWGLYSMKDSKLVLIGSSHKLPFQAFATNEAIQCTEVYEFARSLDSSNPFLETFQSYKLVYALRLAECGFPAEALRYCEVISHFVKKNPAAYQVDFLSQVYELASKLKYKDLHYDMCPGEVSEMPDPKWLTELQSLVDAARLQAAQEAALQNAAQNAAQAAETPLHHQHATGVPDQSMNYGVDSYQHLPTNTDTYQQHTSAVNEPVQEGFSVSSESYQPVVATTSYPGNANAHTDVMDGSLQYSMSYPASSQSPTKQAMPSESQVNHTPDPERMTPQVGMMSPQESQYPAYGGNYWTGYSHPDPNASYQHTEHTEATHSSLPPSPETSGEQRPPVNMTSVSQPNSLSNYPSYQPWDQQLPQNQLHQQPLQQEDPNQAMDPMAPTSHEPPTSSVADGTSQLTAEEKEYYEEMYGSKGNIDNMRQNSKSETRGQDDDKEEFPAAHPGREESKAKRVSFKPQASPKEKASTTSEQQQTDSIGPDDYSGSHTKSSINSVKSSVSIVRDSLPRESDEYAFKISQQPFSRIANMEIVASYSAYHRLARPPHLPCTFRSAMFPTLHRMPVPSNPLIFGGSFPIDDPVSARKLGSGCVATIPRTYQVDTICCQAPNLCDEHARLGQSTDIARAEARLQAAQCYDSDDEPSQNSTSKSPVPSVSSSVEGMVSPVMSTQDSQSSELQSSNPCDNQGCSCNQSRNSVLPYGTIFTCPVDRNLEDGLIPLIVDEEDINDEDDDEDDYNFDYENEECDEFENNLHEYENGEEVGSQDCDYEAGYQLRHRHSSVVSTDAPTSVADSIPSSLQSVIPEPVDSLHIGSPSYIGFLHPPQHQLAGGADMTSSALRSPSVCQPPPHSSSYGSPSPPPGSKAKATQSTNKSTADTPPKEKKEDGSKGDKVSEQQDKNSAWSISSLFGWKKTKQAVLPDDKNPTIVWDNDKKKWVNQDGDDEVASPPPPPPKDAIGGPGPPPTMIRTTTQRKSRYVNTEKPVPEVAGGMPPVNNPLMAPVPGFIGNNSNVPPPNFLVPAPMPVQEVPPGTPQQPDQQAHQPLQQKGPPHSTTPSLSDKDQGTLNEGGEASGAVPMMVPPTGQPQFFNPTQFKPPTSSTASHSQARRLGPGRRPYPAKR